MIDQDEYAVVLLKHHAPQFLRDAKKISKRPLSERLLEVTLVQFENAPTVLYAAAYYASKHGITIVLPPERSATA